MKSLIVGFVRNEPLTSTIEYALIAGGVVVAIFTVIGQVGSVV